VTPTSLRIDAGLWALLAAALALGAVLAAPSVLRGDALYWHIAAGRWMIENRAILRIDPFSLSNAGQLWAPREWLSQLALALVYVGPGWNAVLVLAGAAASGAAGMLGFHLARGGRDGVTLVWLGLAFVCGAGAVSAEPYLLALPCLVGWTMVLVEARARDRAPPLALLAVMLVWANLGPSFVLGLILVLVLGAEAVMHATDRLGVLRRWSVFAGFTLVVGLITPTGVVGLAQALRMLVPHGAVVSFLPLLVALPAAAMVLAQRQRWLRALPLAGLFVLALVRAEDRLFLAVMAPLLAVEPNGEAAWNVRLRSLALLALAALVAIGARLILPLNRGDDARTPQTALAHLPEDLTSAAVLNDPAFGGYLIFRHVKPLIDNRPVYAASFRRRYAAMMRPDPVLLADSLERYHIGWTILTPDDPVAKLLDGEAGWTRLYADQWAVVHVRAHAR
jgi:hypothetical protein